MNSRETTGSALALIASKQPLLIGHRGFGAAAPENTLPSFQLALDANVDLVELDYHHGKDGVPIAIHDSTLDRTTNARRKWKRARIKVSNQTADEIQALDAGSWFNKKFAGAKVPLLTEALDYIQGAGGVTLIEHKSGDSETLARLLRKRDLINKVIVISFHWKFLREFHELEPNQVLGALGPPAHLADGKRCFASRKPLSIKWLERMASTGARLVVWNRRVSRTVIEKAREGGLAVWVYTVDDPKRARRLIQLGVTGIITNDPVRIEPVVRAND